MRRVCVLLSIAALCLLAPIDARTSHADASPGGSDASTLLSMPVAAASQLATMMPTKPLRTSASVVLAVLPAAVLVTAAIAFDAAMQRRRSSRELVERRTLRLRGPPVGAVR